MKSKNFIKILSQHKRKKEIKVNIMIITRKIIIIIMKMKIKKIKEKSMNKKFKIIIGLKLIIFQDLYKKKNFKNKIL